MAQVNDGGMFTTFKMTEGEMRMARSFSPETKMMLQNLLAAVAIDKLNTPMDTINPVANVQTEAYLRGQLDTYNYLLALTKEAEAEEKAAVTVELNPENY